MLFKNSSLLLFLALSFMSLQTTGQTTGQSLSVGPNCAPDYLDGLTEALIPSCWAKKKLSNLASTLTDADLLKSDHEICHCLRDQSRTKSEPIRKMMMAPPILSPLVRTRNPVEIFKENVESLQNELKQDRDGMAFSAYVMSGDKSFTNTYLRPSAATSSASNPDPLQGCFDRVCSLSHQVIELNEQKQIDEIVSTFSVPSKVNKSLFQDKEFHPKQCVSAREYLAFRQLPSEDILKTKIKDTSMDNFNEDEWNHFKLLEQYDEQMALSDSEKNKPKILELKAKLTFLNRNPMIKTFLASDTEYGPLDKNENISHEKSRDIKNKLSGFKVSLVDKKKELIGFLKAFVKNENNNDNTRNYHEKLKNFFVRPEIGELMEIEFEKQSYKKMLGLKDKDNFVGRNDLSHKTVVDSFIRDTGLGNPNNCNSETFNVESCVNIYSQYCKKLDTVMNRVITAYRDPAFVDDLRESTKNDFNTDFLRNSDFQEYNDKICTMKRGKTTGKNHSIDFFTYRFKKCGPRITGECDYSPESVMALRNQFLKEYNRELYPGEDLGHKSSKFESFLTSHKIKPIRGVKDEVNSNDDEINLGMGRALNNISRSWGISPEESGGASNPDKVKINEVSTFFDGSKDQAAMNGELYNYQNTNPIIPKVQNAASEGDKIENMTDTGRQNLLSDWESQYDDWRKSKGEKLNPKDTTTDATLRSEIATLKALLAQQQQLSQEQYHLLNKAIASKTTKSEVQMDPDRKPLVKQSPPTTSGPIFGAPPKDSVHEFSRAPANFKEAQVSSVGSSSPASASRNSSFKASTGSGNLSSDGTSDSVTREQSKLVNLRQLSDGSIQVESVSRTGSLGPNAISLPVSDEQYRILQVNPSGLNLNQLEKSIPKDHIDRLEKNGEITILLRNGNHPPFELKVQRKQNKLVYSLKDKNGNNQVPLKRVYTRRALELELKQE